jgi:mannitol-1-phosphate/altronate dehydrogenase
MKSEFDFQIQVLVEQNSGSVPCDERWGIVGVSVRSRALRDTLARQDFLFSVLACNGESTAVTVVGSLIDFIVSNDDTDGREVLERLADPRTKIVSLTVTEKVGDFDRNKIYRTNHDTSSHF